MKKLNVYYKLSALCALILIGLSLAQYFYLMKIYGLVAKQGVTATNVDTALKHIAQAQHMITIGIIIMTVVLTGTVLAGLVTDSRKNNKK